MSVELLEFLEVGSFSDKGDAQLVILIVLEIVYSFLAWQLAIPSLLLHVSGLVEVKKCPQSLMSSRV